MPNHVRNILKFTGDFSEIKNMLEMIQQDDFGIGSIDFNKLIPMPDSLKITSGSDTIKGYKYYRDFVGEMLSANKVKTIDDLKLCDEDENQYLNSHSEIDRDVWNLGKAAFINEYLYGAQTWYEWSIENWGTKWNSYGYRDNIENWDEAIQFETAWAAPYPVIEKLASEFPNIRFDHAWADEDLGNNCGMCTYENGKRVSELIPSNRVEGVEFACAVWEYDLEDLGLYLNASETDFIYPDEELEIVHLDDKEILFTTDKLTDEDIPKGLYAYHLRENLDKDPMSYIEKTAREDFAATFITKEKLDLGEKGHIALIPSEHLTFTDQKISVLDFLNGDMEQAYDALPFEESEQGPSM